MSHDTSKQLPRPLAKYSNYFEVGQNQVEFLIYFGQFSAEANTVAFDYYVVTAPAVAKNLIARLERAIKAHEAGHGEIRALDELDLPEFLLRSLPNLRLRAKTRAIRQRQALQDGDDDRNPVTPDCPPTQSRRGHKR